MIEQVRSPRIGCDRMDDQGEFCPARLHGAPGMDDAEVRLIARERGWQAGDDEGAPDRCPQHADRS